jgi:hypothetical protein
MPEDDRGIEYAIHNGKSYYNWTNAAKYVENMTDSGLRRKVKALEAETGISIPLIKLPFSQQNVYHDKRVLDVFRRAVKVGREQEWVDELRRVVDEVNNED